MSVLANVRSKTKQLSSKKVGLKMFQYPQYGSQGEEELFFPNRWTDNRPQPIVGVDCFQPFAQVNNLQNRFVWECTGDEFRQVLSSLLLGSKFAYPQTYLQVVANFLRMVHCPIEFEEECQVMPPYSANVQYAPQNPFSTPDLIPDGYLTPPFVLVTEGNIGEYPQNEIGDVAVGVGAINFDVNWFEDIAGQLPTVEIRVIGEGTVNIEFLNQVQGGLVVVTVDNPPNIADIIIGIVTGAENIIDTNMDILSLPPETAITQIYPVRTVGAGLHTIYAVWLPILDDSLIPIRFGGGFRKFELCDFEEFPDMGITDLRFSPTLRLQKLVLGEWSDVEGADDFETFILAVQTIANRASNGVQQILTMSIDPTHPDYTWLGSVHQMYLSAVQQDAAIARIVAESLRDVTDIGASLPDAGFVGSALQDYIDAIEFDSGSLEASIAAAAAAAAAAQDTADAAQASADSANMAIAAIEADIDSLDARLGVLEALQITTQHWDFKADNFDFAEAFPATWTPSVGFEFSDDMVLDKASSGFADGRIMAYRLELRRIDSGEANYTSEIVGDLESYGKLENGLNVHFHKVGNMAVQQDLELELTCDTGDYVLEGLTIYFYGATMAYDD